MDLDAVADELYGLPPGEFTAARDERARAARTAGDRELAERIRRLRRPTLAAYAGNLLARERPDEAGQLLRLGEALRQAHQDLDGEQLRQLSARQHQLTFTLSRQAGELAARAGQHLSDGVRQEVQDTLHAVLADPAAAGEWARGRLTRALAAPVGFPAAATRPSAAKVTDLDSARARRRKRQDEERERARRRADEARREQGSREAELSEAEAARRRAEEEQRQAEQRVSDLTRQLHDAERDQRRSQEAAQQARDHAQAADRALREARRRAEDAAARADKLDRP
ncbi:hypothetical protein [Streptomyces sp. B93]|uniref:hypothetical protein n=1 Tax=Streptomyces sp. B93 TaxID=2824875 RepID=UPI001B3971B8|nr:hypothetical protein [Streptomyces sp. B93]MBQ1089437.1 hypothetical protein [Streptomyces sp. B93]